MANLLLLTLNRSRSEAHRNELFQFVEDKGYDIGNLEERHNTFITLGIKEE